MDTIINEPVGRAFVDPNLNTVPYSLTKIY